MRRLGIRFALKTLAARSNAIGIEHKILLFSQTAYENLLRIFLGQTHAFTKRFGLYHSVTVRIIGRNKQILLRRFAIAGKERKILYSIFGIGFQACVLPRKVGRDKLILTFYVSYEI